MMRHPFTLGAVFPDDAWVQSDVAELIADFRSYVPSTVRLEAVATPTPNATATAETGRFLATNGDIEEAARRLQLRHSCDVIAYFCTTVSFIRGPGGDQDIIQRIQATTNRKATTTSTAIVAALRSLDVRKVAIASPYMPEVEDALVEFLRAHGFETVSSVALNLPTDHSIVAPADIIHAAREADHPSADAVLVSCTGQRVSRFLAALENELGKSVLASNQVTAWHALEVGGAPHRFMSRGKPLSLKREN